MGRAPLGPAGVNQAPGTRCLGLTGFHPHASLRLRLLLRAPLALIGCTITQMKLAPFRLGSRRLVSLLDGFFIRSSHIKTTESAQALILKTTR